MTLLEIATRAVCQEIGLHPDRWESFAHLSQAAFDAIAAHLPEDVRTLFVAEEPRPLAGVALVCAATLAIQPDHGEQDEAAPIPDRPRPRLTAGSAP